MSRSASLTPDHTVLGVLMLDTNFPRPVGDIGNPASFDHPVIYRRLPGAIVSRIVTDRPLADELVDHFIEQARALEKDGATLITTSCGFLFPLQSRIQAAVSVPVARATNTPDAEDASRTFSSVAVTVAPSSVVLISVAVTSTPRVDRLRGFVPLMFGIPLARCCREARPARHSPNRRYCGCRSHSEPS